MGGAPIIAHTFFFLAHNPCTPSNKMGKKINFITDFQSFGVGGSELGMHSLRANLLLIPDLLNFQKDQESVTKF